MSWLGCLLGAVVALAVRGIVTRRRFRRACLADGVCPRCGSQNLRSDKVLDWRAEWAPGIKCHGCYAEFVTGKYDVRKRIAEARKKAVTERVAKEMAAVEKDRWN
jgi:transposase-like protein